MLLATFTSICALGADTTGAATSFDSALAAVLPYEYGQSRAALFALEKAVQAGSGDAEARANMASKMAKALSGGATVDCKRFLCGQISLVGAGKEVSPLAELLSDPELRVAARSALERIPGEDAVVAMRAALSKRTGLTALGLMDTLGKRKDAGAIVGIAAFMRDKDKAVAAGAAAALGKIGGAEAMALLVKADEQVSAEVRFALNDALLACADGLAKQGDTGPTADVYKKLSEPGRPAHVKLAAFPGLIASRQGKGASLLLDALTGDDAAMRRAAGRSLRTFKGNDITIAVAKKLAGLDPKAQVQIISALADRGDAAALPGIQELLQSSNAEVRAAAVTALGSLGDASTVAVLSRLIEDKDLGKAAFHSLTRIKGAGAEEAIVGVLKTGAAPEKARVAAVLRERDARGAVPALLAAATDDDAKVRKEALRALGAMASASECSGLVRLLDRPESAGDLRSVENALVAVCGRHGNAGDAIAKAAGRASGAARMSLLSILGKTGGNEALRVLMAALKDSDKETRTAAVKAVSQWPNAEPLPELVAFLRAEKEVVPKALAFRAFAGLSGRDSSLSADEIAGLYAEVMALADRPEDVKTLVGGLANAPSPDTLKLAVSFLKDDNSAGEAALAVVQIAPHLLASHGKEVKSAAEAVLASCRLDAARAKAKDILFQLSKPVNIARAAKASSPDGVEKDGQSGGDQAAIDGDPNTYWDEDNGKQLYILRLEFRRAVTGAAIGIMGYQHHAYAPKDFDVVCDGKTVKKVSNASYTKNWLRVDIPQTTFKTLELKITKYYSGSPAIRELEIYGASTRRSPQ